MASQGAAGRGVSDLVTPNFGPLRDEEIRNNWRQKRAEPSPKKRLGIGCAFDFGRYLGKIEVADRHSFRNWTRLARNETEESSHDQRKAGETFAKEDLS